MLANSKFANSIVNSLTTGTKSKTPKPAKTPVTHATDTDLDGVTDDLDLDDDNDGILDTAECPATDIVTNGAFTTNLTGWTAGTGWAFSSGTATNTSDFTTSSLSQSLNNLDKVPNNTASLTVKVGAQDASNSAGNTSSLDIMLGDVVYATISNSLLRDTNNVTISLTPGVTSNFVTFGTSGTTGFTTPTVPGVLVLEANNKAMILPKVASPRLNIVNPEPGTMAYDTVKKQLAIFNGKVWSFWKP